MARCEDVGNFGLNYEVLSDVSSDSSGESDESYYPSEEEILQERKERYGIDDIAAFNVNMMNKNTLKKTKVDMKNDDDDDDTFGVDGG